MKKLLLFISLLFAFNLNAQIFSEDFEGMTVEQDMNQNDWITIDTSGTPSLWIAKSYSSNKYAQIRAYDEPDSVKAFLISPIIDLTNVSGTVNLSFDVKVAYWSHQGLKVYITSDINTFTDTITEVENANLVLIADQFQEEPTSGYGDFINYTSDISSFAGSSIRVVFYYEGNSANSQTTTYQVDNVVIAEGGSFTPQSIDYAYTLNDSTIIVKYENKFENFDENQFVVNGSNFTVKNINLNDSIEVIITTNESIAFDIDDDNIDDPVNNTEVTFLAGFAPIEAFSTVYSGDTIPEHSLVTVKGYVTANSEYKNIWIQDANELMHGINIYDSNGDLPDMVSVGDSVVIVGTKTYYYGLTEILYKALVCNNSNVSSPIEPMVIQGNAIGFAPGSNGQTQDDPNIEPYENILVKINNAQIISGPTEYYEYVCTDDDGTTNFIIDDFIDYQWESYSTIDVNALYNITGIVTYSYGFYRLLPLQSSYNGLELVQTTAINDPANIDLTIYPNPVNNILNISAKEQIVKLEVYNSVGQLVKDFEPISQQASISLEDLNSGIYFVRVYTQSGISSQKIIKK